MYKMLLGDMLAISTKAYPKKDAVVFYEADGERKSITYEVLKKREI